jgi:hypothetical protein
LGHPLIVPWGLVLFWAFIRARVPVWLVASMLADMVLFSLQNKMLFGHTSQPDLFARH